MGKHRDVMDLESSPKPHVLRALASYTADAADRALLLLLAGDGKVWPPVSAHVRMCVRDTDRSVKVCGQPTFRYSVD